MYPRLKELRLEKGLTQKQVAEYLHIATTTYRFYEKNKRRIPTLVFKELADLYDVSVDYLLNLTDERQTYPRI